MTHHQLTLTSPKQRQGRDYERMALTYLKHKGLQCIAQNWLAPKLGELDLVMLEYGKGWNTIVFIEVRQRKTSIYGDAVMSVTKSKQSKIIRAARHFLNQHRQYADCECRFDVIAYDISSEKTKQNVMPNKNDMPITVMPINNVSIPQPKWIQGAFIANAWH